MRLNVYLISPSEKKSGDIFRFSSNDAAREGSSGCDSSWSNQAGIAILPPPRHLQRGVRMPLAFARKRASRHGERAAVAVARATNNCIFLARRTMTGRPSARSFDEIITDSWRRDVIPRAPLARDCATARKMCNLLSAAHAYADAHAHDSVHIVCNRTVALIVTPGHLHQIRTLRVRIS